MWLFNGCLLGEGAPLFLLRVGRLSGFPGCQVPVLFSSSFLVSRNVSSTTLRIYVKMVVNVVFWPWSRVDG